MKDTPKSDNRRKYDAAFRAEALRLAEQSRSIQAAARAGVALDTVIKGLLMRSLFSNFGFFKEGLRVHPV